MRRTQLLFTATWSLTAVFAVGGAPSPRAQGPVVRQVDHILVVAKQAEELFRLLTETFQLPVAWPMSRYGNFASGGVALGNVNLEILLDDSATADGAAARWTGLALEPQPLANTLPELAARRIACGSPAPFQGVRPDGFRGVLWTTVALPEVAGDRHQLFLCEYGFDVAARRQRLREQLQRSGGGPLTIVSVGEVAVGARDVTAMRTRWQRLLDPTPLADGVWRLADGPAIRLTPSADDAVLGLTVNVRSCSTARAFLEERQLLSGTGLKPLVLGGAILSGLRIVLSEVDP